MELPTLICARLESGRLTADWHTEVWRKVAPVQLRETVSGAVPQQATSVRVAWTEEELRVIFHAEDTHAWATLTERDEPLYEEEVVEVFLDPTGDLASYFEIEVNPLNAVLDLVLRRNRSGYAKDFAWRCEGLRTAVVKTDAAWTAEMAIPFRSLVAEPPQAGDCWRVNFLRIDRPSGVPRELSSWSPAGRASFHTPERFGTLQFAE